MSTKNKSQLQQELNKLQEVKAKLIEAKRETPDKFTEKHQAKLDKVTEDIVDLEEQIELAPEEAPEEASEKVPEKAPEVTKEKKADAYVPKKGTEDCVHLSIVRGRRFNPNTGKEESLPYNQIFTRGEFALFKANAKLLGYSVLKVLHDPTGEAQELVVK